MHLWNKLRCIYIVLRSKAFYVATDRGCCSHLPLDRQTLEGVQLDLERFDEFLEETINELILEERDCG